MARLLLVSGGDSDLQVVVQGLDGVQRLARIAQETQRAVHERLLDPEPGYVVDPEKAGLEQTRAVRLGVGANGLAIEASGDAAAGMALPEGPVQLAPVKLAGIERLFRLSKLGERKTPDTVLVFNTRRSTRRDEPVAAGVILGRWLAELFGLRFVEDLEAFGVGAVCSVDYVDDAVGPDGPSGMPVNPAAVQRIDDALLRLPRGDIGSVTFALSGGIPAYRDQIRACARFRFPQAQFLECRRTDDPERGLLTSREAAWLPADSMRIRAEVLRLLRGGDFHGASTLATQLATQPSEARWVTVVQEAARLVEGGAVSGDGGLTGLIPALKGKPGRAFSVAMRAEAALRANRVLEAVLWTSTVADAGFVDLLERLDFVAHLDEYNRIIRARAPIPADLLAPGPAPALEQRGNQYAYWNKFPNREKFYNHFGQKAASALRGLNDAMERRVVDQTIRIREIRNVISHGALPAESVRWLRQSFMAAGLWSPKPPHLLGNKHVRALVESIENVDPAVLYEEIVENACQVMENHRYAPTIR